MRRLKITCTYVVLECFLLFRSLERNATSSKENRTTRAHTPHRRGEHLACQHETLLVMARLRIEWLTLVHRLRVQDPWLKVLQQEARNGSNTVVAYYCTTQTVVLSYRRSVPCECRDL